MPGILKFAAMGAAEGLGRGMAQMGSTLGQEALMNERYRLSQERDKERDELMRERMDRNQSLYLARLEAKERGEGGGGGKGGGSAVSQAQALANMPEAEMGRLLRQRMGDAGEVQSYLDHVYRGQSPTQDMTLDPQRFVDPSKFDDYSDPNNPVKRDLGGQSEVPKYEDGKWREVMEQAGRQLHEAFKLANPGHADDLAKSRATDEATDAALQYRESGKRADLNVALTLQGKDPEAATTAANARVEAARETTRGRVAAAAAKPSGGGASLRGDETLKVLDARRKLLDTNLAVAERQQRDLSLTKDDKALKKAEIEQIKKQREELGAALASRAGMAKPAAASAPTPTPAAAPAPAGLSGADAQALAWANANPSDPRAAQIKRRLGVK